MSGTKRTLTLLAIVVAMVLAFLAGTVTATSRLPTAVQALTPGQWASLQASNSLLLDQGPLSLYLPVVLHHW